MRMSSIMRWRSGLIPGLGVVMAGLLSSNEAECLIAQHRKPSGFPMKNHHVQTQCIPRERFSPLADKRRSRLPDTRPLDAPCALTKTHRPRIVAQDAQYEWI